MPPKRILEESENSISKKAKHDKQYPLSSVLTPSAIDFPRGVENISRASDLTASKFHSNKHSDVSGRKKERKSLIKPRTEKNEPSRIEHLNYKRIIPGMKVLTRVVAIHPFSAIVSLPNQLLGHIPISQISAEYTAMLEVQDDTQYENMHSYQDSMIPELRDILHPGQYLPATVTAVHPQGARQHDHRNGNGRDELMRMCQRVELSTIPSRVNDLLTPEKITAGSAILAAVHEIEDHGYLMDLGVSGIKGFLPFTHISPTMTPSSRLHVGEVKLVTVKRKSDGGRLCHLECSEKSLQNGLLQNAISAEAISPGSLVQGLVISTSASGVVFRLFGSFEGTADVFHCPTTQISTLKPGVKVKVRILYRIPSSYPPKFVVSLLPHVIDITCIHFLPSPSVGTILESVQVQSVLPDWGVVVSVSEETGDRGFVHISQLSDDHVSSLSTTGPFRVGSTHTARVTGYHSMDQLLQLSLKHSVLERQFFQVSDLIPGEVITGCIKKVTDKGIFLSISGNIDAVIWPNHFADISLHHPQKRFRERGILKCKVLSVDPASNRVVLTAKKSLVESKFPSLCNFKDARVGMVTHAFVHKVLKNGLLIEFYNNLKAFVPQSELIDSNNMSTDFPPGKPILPMIIGVDAGKERIIASIRRIHTNTDEPVEFPEIGSSVSGLVVEILPDQALVILQPSNRRAFVSMASLSEHRAAYISKLSTALIRGEEVRDLVVTSFDRVNDMVIVSPSVVSVHNGSAGRELYFESIFEGMQVTGRVIASGPRSAIVRIAKSVIGVLHTTDCVDDFSRHLGESPIKSVVKAVVVGRDLVRKQVHLSTRPSRMNESSNAVDIPDPEVVRLEDLSEGQTIRGFVKSIASNGLYVIIGRDLDARVQIRELFDEFVKDWQAHFQVGQVVSGRVLRIDLLRGQVEFSLRSSKIVRQVPGAIGVGALKSGQILDGRVKNVQDYGIFIELVDSKISGLCHKSEICDSLETDTQKALRSYNEGDLVKVKVIAIDISRNRVAFGLKPSYMNGSFCNISATNLSSPTIEVEKIKGATMISSSPEPQLSNTFSKIQHGTSSEEKSMELDNANSLSLESLEAPMGFNWDISPVHEETRDPSTALETKVDGSGSFTASMSNDQIGIEVDHTLEVQQRIPQSNLDFERLLLGSPNSSYLWIRYASFYLKLSDIGRARDILRQALRIIHFREERERFNIWLSLLNLECTFGDDQKLEQVFQEAVKANDAKTVYLKVASILQQAEKPEKAAYYYRKSVQKYGDSSKVWTSFAEFRFQRNDYDAARQLLPQSLTRLEKRKHVKTITKFSQLEFKYGDSERGRTIFEGLLESYPKRVDLWFIYIDMEVKEGDFSRVRSMFNRLLDNTKITSHKAKSAFKKWLALEKRFGDASSTELVTTKAKEWYQKKTTGVRES